MKIVALSDTHMRHDQIPMPDGDILIHAGDLTGIGNYSEFVRVGEWLATLKDKYKHRIIIAGNHDWGLQLNSARILKECFDEDVIYLQDSEIIIDGIKFYGTPWCPQFFNWAFMDRDENLAKKWELIPKDVEILITHSPPYGILDGNDSGDRCGGETMLWKLKELTKLKHHIFGHLHASYGQEKIDDVIFHNVCSLNDSYRYQNPPQIIEV